MLKKYKLSGLDCANCARELEEELNKVEKVKQVKINFMMQKMTLEAEDSVFEEVLAKVKKICSKFEDGIDVIGNE